MPAGSVFPPDPHAKDIPIENGTARIDLIQTLTPFRLAHSGQLCGHLRAYKPPERTLYVNPVLSSRPRACWPRYRTHRQTINQQSTTNRVFSVCSDTRMVRARMVEPID